MSDALELLNSMISNSKNQFTENVVFKAPATFEGGVTIIQNDSGAEKLALDLVGRYDLYNAQKFEGQTPLSGTPLDAIKAPHTMQGIDFNADGTKAYITCAAGFSMLEVNLDDGSIVPHMVYNPENPNQVHLPDDVTRVGNTLYYTNLVSFDLVVGNYTRSGGVYKLDISGPNAFVPQKFWNSAEGEAMVNPIEYADGYIYTATTLGFRFNLYHGGSENDPYPHYPQMVYKINATTGELVWKKQYERYINAFDIRDGWIYAGAARGGGKGDTFMSQGDEFAAFSSLRSIALVRISTETGELQELIGFPKMPQSYIVNCKFVHDKLMVSTDKVWCVNYDTFTKNVNTESFRLAYDFAKHEPTIRVRDLFAYFADNTRFAQNNMTILDNAKMHPDGKHFYIVGSESGLMKMRVQEEHIKPVHEFIEIPQALNNDNYVREPYARNVTLYATVGGPTDAEGNLDFAPGTPLEDMVNNSAHIVYPQLNDLKMHLSPSGLLTSEKLVFDPPLDGASQGYPADVEGVQWRGNQITGDTMMYASRELVPLMYLTDGTTADDILAQVIYDVGEPFRRVVARDGKAYYTVAIPSLVNPTTRIMALSYYIGEMPYKY